jgi:hypothetical protein
LFWGQIGLFQAIVVAVSGLLELFLSRFDAVSGYLGVVLGQ